MNVRLFRPVLLFALLGLLPSAAMANQFDVGVFAGYALIANNTELGNAYYLPLPNDVPGNAPVFGARATYWPSTTWALEAEARYASSALRSTGEAAPLLGWRGYLRYDTHAAGALQPFFRLGLGGERLLSTVRGAEADTDSAFLLGAGLHIPSTDYLNFRLDAVYYATRGTPDMTLAHNAEVQLGFGFRAIDGADTDGDGVVDRSDNCPKQAEDKDGFEDDDGCPDLDNDKDGLADTIDKCPNVAEDKDGFEDWDGCPDLDNDKDGIADTADKCPNKPENKNGYQDDDGCPDDPDTDGDGIPDSKDKCPKEPETKNGFKDDDGCPDIGDDDHDGVPDDKDKCPDKAETKNGYQDDDGCPDTVPAKIAKMFSGTIKGIEFETGSAKILPSSFKTLGVAIAILKEFPALKVEISGHTDNTGSPEGNKKLSQERADSVKAYMTSKEIDGERLLAIGYGEDKPIADNSTKGGKQKNRRIEFHLQPLTEQ